MLATEHVIRGMPVILSDVVPDDGTGFVMHDPAGGTTIVLRRGSPMGDRVQYGMEDGHLIGPLRRAEALIAELGPDGRIARAIDHAYQAADIRLFLLEQSFKAWCRNHPLDGPPVKPRPWRRPW